MKRFLAVLMILGLVACSSSDKKEPLPGDRIPLKEAFPILKPDARIDHEVLAIPPAEKSTAWLQVGANPAHLLGHHKIAEKSSLLWSASIGAGVDRDAPSQPTLVGGDNVLFAMDTDGQITAFDAKSGDEKWQTNVVTEDDGKDLLIRGGLAYENGTLYVTYGSTAIVALKAADGTEIWRQNKILAPIESPPTVSYGKVFAMTIEGRLYALDAKTGKRAWVHQGLAEEASLMRATNVAVRNGMLAATYSNGELIILRPETGLQLWASDITAMRKADNYADFPNITALPIIDHGAIIAVSQSGNLVALSAQNGRQFWSVPVGSTQTPVLTGNAIYMISEKGELVAIKKNTGQIRWVKTLPSFEKSDDDMHRWLGPLLINDKVVAFGDNGQIAAFSTEDGMQKDFTINDSTSLDDEIGVTPIVMDGVLYVLTQSGRIYAYQ